MTELARSIMYRIGGAEPKLADDTDSQESLAYHEAGHAIMGRLTYRKFEVIAMSAEAGYVGGGDAEITSYIRRIKSKDATLLTPKPLGPHGALLKPLAARRICDALGGLQAELLLSGEPPEGVYREDFDHRGARQYAREAFGVEHLEYFQALTRDYLQRCWGEIGQTAAELLARFDRHGFAVIRKSDPGDVSFFTRDNLPVTWRDEEWD